MNAEQKIKKPSLFWLMSEGGRAAIEMGIYFASSPLLEYFSEKGDDHTVIVLPGFMASNSSTSFLRKFLNKIGYNAIGWPLGRNYGDPELINQLFEYIHDQYLESGKPVSLIGWSLGGVFARQVAKEMPHAIRQVITLGSPFKGLDQPNYANWLYKLVSDNNGIDGFDEEFLNELNEPANVPTTAIYSKEDGIVPWEVCQEDEDDFHQNIQVRGAHIGLGHNATVLKIIADRLQYDAESWLSFEAGEIESALFYPSLS